MRTGSVQCTVTVQQSNRVWWSSGGGRHSGAPTCRVLTSPRTPVSQVSPSQSSSKRISVWEPGGRQSERVEGGDTCCRDEESWDRLCTVRVSWLVYESVRFHLSKYSQHWLGETERRWQSWQNWYLHSISSREDGLIILLLLGSIPAILA